MVTVMAGFDGMRLLGGLALFLYGMRMMSDGLEQAAGKRMRRILTRLTSNRVKGVLAGAAVTALIQSSSAVTVMAVGFVDAQWLTLEQALWIIMGANIGTTVTGQLIALDITAAAPVIAFAGVLLQLFVREKSRESVGSVPAGFGILLIGIRLMEEAMTPLRHSGIFLSMAAGFEHPLYGIPAGAAFTALIQSSSASVGILQALAAGGTLGLKQAVYVLFGQNIGTCVTAVLAAVGKGLNAKRTTLLHLMFNLTGTALFTALCMVTPLTAHMEALSPGNPAAQIANMHTVFNVVTALFLLPFGTLMTEAARRLLPDKKAAKKSCNF